MIKMLVTGADSGLGKCIVAESLRGNSFEVYETSEMDCDIRDEKEVARLAEDISDLDILVNNAGVNMISRFEDLEVAEWDQVMEVNVRGIFLMMKHFLPHLKRSKGTMVVVASNASYVPMTHSLVYNSSKAAAAMMVKQMAREMTKLHGITVFGINPNKLEGTAMSQYIDKMVPRMRGWSPEHASKYMLDSLVTGFETKPEWVAELLVWLLAEKHRHAYLSGCLLNLGT